MHPLGPDLIRFRANKEFRKLQEVFSVCWATAGTAINFGLCVLPLFIEPVYRLWTRGKLAFDFPLFSLLALSVAFRTFGHPGLAFLQSTNALKAQAKISVTRGVLVIALSLALIYPFGLLGVGAALAISEIIGAAILPLAYAMADFKHGESPFPYRRMATAASSVGVVAISFAACCLFPAFKVPISSVSAAAVLVLGFLQWSLLDFETRRRMLSILHLPKWLDRNFLSTARVKTAI
jgi:O-antigen/teichoic acid export membrane protein